jgi:serine/threonine protein phosphatase PrpC
VLWGDQHGDLGATAVEEVGPHLAIALSAGRFPKRYGSVDANEDAVLAATAPQGWLLAVADGHLGFDAACGAIGAVQRVVAALFTKAGSDGSAAVAAAFGAAREGVRDALDRAADEGRQGSRTALSVVLAVGDRLHTATLGDTAVLLVPGRGAIRRPKLLSDAAPFLGPGTSLPAPRQAPLRPGDAVVAVSDGVTMFLGRRWQQQVKEIVERTVTPRDTARAMVEAAFAAGAGDHVSVGVARR